MSIPEVSLLQVAVLAYLWHGERRALEARAYLRDAHGWEADSPAAFYQLMRRMESDGLVESRRMTQSENPKTQVAYLLTRAGGVLLARARITFERAEAAVQPPDAIHGPSASGSAPAFL